MDTNSEVKALFTWAFGNGARGAEERLRLAEEKLDQNYTGERRCMGHRKLDDHLDWHKRNKIFLWAIMVPVYLTALTMILQVAGVIG